MNRDKLTSGGVFIKRSDFVNQVAFHEAGHAAAIYLRNKQINLPQIYFHIALSGYNRQKSRGDTITSEAQDFFQPVVEGGLLHLQSLGMSTNPNCQSVACLDCRLAYEADVINLLAGPLAEAMHVALRDGEAINRHLVDLDALKHYGGQSDMEKVEDYLNAFSSDPQKRLAKLRGLYAASFEFISEPVHWRAITSLADYISSCGEELIAYEEAVAVLDAAVSRSAGSVDSTRLR